MSENWDEHAKDWDRDEHVRSYSEKAFASLIKHVDVRENIWKSKRVLDFGCGTGLLTEIISPLVKEVIAVDTSQKMIEELKGKQLGEQEVGAIATAAIKVLERIGMDEAPKVVMARAYLPEAVDAEIRRRHPILLPREVRA